MTQNDSFYEIRSLSPSEKKNQKIEKSIEISIEDCKKPYSAYYLNSHMRPLVATFGGDSVPIALKTRVFVCFVCGLFCPLSFCVVNCLNSLEKQEIKTLCSEVPCTKYKCEHLECKHYTRCGP